MACRLIGNKYLRPVCERPHDSDAADLSATLANILITPKKLTAVKSSAQMIIPNAIKSGIRRFCSMSAQKKIPFIT